VRFKPDLLKGDFAKHTYLFSKGAFLKVELFGTLAPIWRCAKIQAATKPPATSLKPIKWLSQKTRK
jgi:hypothetical protein